MGTINIYSGNGANKAGLIYNGSGDITVDTEHLANTSSDVQAQIDTKAPINNAQFTGNVRIGIDHPSSGVNASDDYSNPDNYNLVLPAARSTNNKRGIGFVDSGNINSAILGVDEGTGGAQGLSLYTGTGASIVERVRIKSNGNVGIGTSTPNYDLVINNSSGPPLRLDTNLAAANASVVMTESNGTSSANGGFIRYNGTDNRLELGVGTSWDTTRMVISRDTGNVGIGTPSPTDKFEIHHNDAYEFSLKFNQGNNNIVSGFGQQQSILAYADGASNTDQYYAGITFGLWDATHNSKDGSIHFHTAVNGTVTTGLRITGTGEVLAALEPTLNMAVGTTNASHAKLTVYSGMGDKPALLLSNADGGANAYANRNSRYLASNGSNWIGDGKDPIAVIGIDSNSTDKFPSTGLVMHNESQTDNTFSTPIMFGNRSNSGAYNTAYAYIAGRKNGQGVDSNWSTGEIWIDTAGTKHNGNDAYMDHSPAIKIRNTGTVDMRWQPFSYGTLGGNNLTNNTGWTLSPLVTQGLVYNNNATHGYGLTVAEPGYYQCFATGLYNPGNTGYIYIGWALNGAQQHHWHSNHVVESNHDFVSSIIRWCNAGDHITLENSNTPIASQWGGAHSQYHVWKVG